MNILQELWYGNIRPNEDKVITDEEKKLVELIAKHHEILSSSLKNEDLVVFEKYAPPKVSNFWGAYQIGWGLCCCMIFGIATTFILISMKIYIIIRLKITKRCINKWLL